MTEEMTGTIRQVDPTDRGSVLTADAAASAVTIAVEEPSRFADPTEVAAVRVADVDYPLAGVDTDTGVLTLTTGLEVAVTEQMPVSAVDARGAVLVDYWAQCEPDDPDDETIPVLMTRETAATLDRDQALEVRVLCRWGRGQYRVVATFDQEPAIANEVLGVQPAVQFTDDGRWPDRKGWALDPITGARFTLRAGGRNSDGTYALVLERWSAAGVLEDSNIVDNMYGSPVAVNKPLKADVAFVRNRLIVLWASAFGAMWLQHRSTATLELTIIRDYPYSTFAKGRKSPAVAHEADNPGGVFVARVAQSRPDINAVRQATYAFGTTTLVQSSVVDADLDFARDLAHFGLRPDISDGAWQIASTNEGARVYVFDADGDPIPGDHWSTGTDAGLVGVAIDADATVYSMDRGGVERQGPAARGSEAAPTGSDIPDLRRVVTVTTVSGSGTIPHDRGVAPTGVVCTSMNNGRRVSWANGITDDDEIGFFVRTGGDNLPVDGDTLLSFIAWWD